MSARYDITRPVADQLRAVRDDHLMATPDKIDTAYAVMTRSVSVIEGLLEAGELAFDLLDDLTTPGESYEDDIPLYTAIRKLRVSIAAAKSRAAVVA